MILMQKLKRMQEFTSASIKSVYIAVCKQNHQCMTAHVQNMQKHVFVAYKKFESSLEWKISLYGAYI